MSGISAVRSVLGELRTRLLALPRNSKRVILATLDFVLLSVALWFLISLRYHTFFMPPSWGNREISSRNNGLLAIPSRSAKNRLTQGRVLSVASPQSVVQLEC